MRKFGATVYPNQVKDVRLPQNLQRAMAAEAEATREARAKVIILTTVDSKTNARIYILLT